MSFPPSQFPPPFSTGNDAPMFWPQGSLVENEQQQSNYSEFPPFKKPRNFEETPSTNSFQNQGMGMNPFQNQGMMMNQRKMMMAPPQNPNQNPRLGKIFFKTRLCEKFKAGHCPYGDNCSYAHGVEDIREPPPNWQKIVASREEDQSTLQTGVNWEDDQRLISKLRLCRRFISGQECPYGDKCNFLHRPIGKCREELRFRESSSISIGTTGSPGNVATLSRPDQLYGDKHQFAAELHNYGGGHNEVVTGSTAIDSAKFIPDDAPNSDAAVVSSNKRVVFAKKCLLNWDTKKLSGIYADWIDPRSPTNVES
ncbi:hypothetical protein MKX03_016323 [Papaver bracteatum]|nr:hypothetical protein MKX03_016323 [Papaver bracteatum]